MAPVSVKNKKSIRTLRTVLCVFLEDVSPNLESLTEVPGNIAWFSSTMAQIQLATSSRWFLRKAHRRKRLLFKHLKALLSNSLSTHFGAGNAAFLSTTVKAQIKPLKKVGKKVRKVPKKDGGAPTAIQACFAHISETIAFSSDGEPPFLDIGVALFKINRTRFFTNAEYVDMRNSYEAFQMRLGIEESRSMHVRQTLVKQVVEVEGEPVLVSA